jgi:hypothetical protein
MMPKTGLRSAEDRERLFGHRTHDCKLVADCVAKLKNDMPAKFRCTLIGLGFSRPNAL